MLYPTSAILMLMGYVYYKRNGIVFEELHEHIKESSTQRKHIPFEEKLIVIINSLDSYLDLFPQFCVQKFACDFACVYNSIKHPTKTKRKKPREFWIDPINLHDLCLISKVIVQIWIAKELGCSPEKIIDKPKDEGSVCLSFERIDRLDFEVLTQEDLGK